MLTKFHLHQLYQTPYRGYLSILSILLFCLLNLSALKPSEKKSCPQIEYKKSCLESFDIYVSSYDIGCVIAVFDTYSLLSRHNLSIILGSAQNIIEGVISLWRMVLNKENVTLHLLCIVNRLIFIRVVDKYPFNLVC